MTAIQPGSGIDRAAETLTRWTAARTTRRSFMHRLGQFAVFIAAGPTVAGILMRRVEARVCGQSGVTPKCDTFDCNGPDDVWGWCWYANDGCCRNDGLKKICDCCTVNYPNVHGYCPSGTNVRCIVESCGTDPRVLDVDLVPLAWDADSGYAASAAVAGQGSATKVILTDAAHPWATAIAHPLGGALGIPVMAMSATGPNTAVVNAINQLGAVEVMLVGPVGPEITNQIALYGVQTTIVAADDDPVALSIAIAGVIRGITSINRSVTVAETGLSRAALPFAASFAARNGYPLAVTADATTAIGMPTLYIGPEPADAGVVAERTVGQTLSALSFELAELAAGAPFVEAKRLTIAPESSADLMGLINTEASIVLHQPNVLDPLGPWLQNYSLAYGELLTVFYVDGPDGLNGENYWRLQGTVNGFRIDQLTGVSGEGLPVRRQPFAERPIGMARIDGALDFGSEPAPSYWTNTAQTFRG